MDLNLTKYTEVAIRVGVCTLECFINLLRNLTSGGAGNAISIILFVFLILMMEAVVEARY